MRRVRITLEQEYWAGLAEIAEREEMLVDELLAQTDRRRATVALPDAVRMLCVGYFRQAATGPGNLVAVMDVAVGATEGRR